MGNRQNTFQGKQHHGTDLMKNFTNLLANLKASSFQTTTAEIAEYINQLPITKTSGSQGISCYDVNHTLIPQLKEAESLEEIFELISPFIKFNQCDLLKFLVEKFGKEDAKRELQEYTSLVEKFNRSTTVGQLVELLVEQQEHWTPEDRDRLKQADEQGCTIKMILDSSYSICTLEQLYSDVSSLFECEEYVLALAQVQFGSIELLWYTSLSIISYLSDKVKNNDEKMKEMKIISLTVGHDHIHGKILSPYNTQSLNGNSNSLRSNASSTTSEEQRSVSLHSSIYTTTPTPTTPTPTTLNVIFYAIVDAIKDCRSQKVTQLFDNLSESDLIAILQMFHSEEHSSLLHIAVQTNSLATVKTVLLAINRTRELNLRWLTNSLEESPLQYALRLSQNPPDNYDVIELLLKYPSFIVIPPNHKNLLALAAEDPKHSKMKLRLILQHSSGNPLDLYPDFKAHFPNLKLPKCPNIESTIPIIVVGDSNAGKSTLIKSLQTQGVRSQFYHLFFNVSGVNIHRAGIIPTFFESIWYGNVVFFDLSSNREFVHEAIQQCGGLVDAVFLMVINLQKKSDDIMRQLVYWFDFIKYHHSRAITDHYGPGRGEGHVPNVAIVGSHLNQIKVGELLANRERFWYQAYPRAAEHFNENLFNIFAKELMDCRKSSVPNTSLRLALSHEFQRLRASRSQIPSKSYLLYEIIQNIGYKREVSYVCINDVLAILHTLEDQVFLPTVNEVLHLTQPLCELNLLLLLRDEEELERSWIIIDPRYLLGLVEEAIFTRGEEEGFTNSRTNNGIMTHDQLTAIFRPYSNIDPEMMIKLMTHYCYCSKTSHSVSPLPNWTRANKYFFPHLLPELPSCSNIIQKKELLFGWGVRPSSPYRHFMPHVIHQFLLQLTEEMEISSGRSYDRARHTLITSLPSIGLELVIHVHASQSIFVSMATTREVATTDEEKVKCMEKRNQLIMKICQILQEVDPEGWTTLEPIQVLISGQDPNFRTHYPILEPPIIRPFFGLGTPRSHTYSVDDVKNAVINRSTHVQPVGHPTPLSSIEDLLFFEPYYHMSDELRRTLVSPENTHEYMSADFFFELARSLLKKHFFLLLYAIQVPGIDIENFKRLAEDNSVSFLDIVTQVGAFIEGRGMTYGQLKIFLDSISFFKLDDIVIV